MLAGPSDYDVSGPGGLEVVGFAVTNSGDVYGALDNLGTDDPKRRNVYAGVEPYG